MTKTKKTSSSKKPISFRFEPEVIELLNELVRTDIKCAHCGKAIKKFNSKIDVIEDSLAALVAFLLRPKISEVQIREHRRNPHRLFQLYIMVCKAERGEQGYSFSDKDKKKRFVSGPEQANDRIYSHMTEEKEETKHK